MCIVKLIFAILTIGHSVAYGGVSRISSIYKDLGKSHKIYLHAGLITVVEFPQNILEVRLGNPKSIKAQISQVSPSRVLKKA